MKKQWIPVLLFAMLTAAQADAQTSKAQKGFGVTVVQTQPEFPGGSDSLQSYIQRNLQYPAEAFKARIQGRTYIGFTVTSEGKVTKAKVLKSANALLDEEAMRMISGMPDWKPGTASGKPVNVDYILPIDFILPPAKN